MAKTAEEEDQPDGIEDIGDMRLSIGRSVWGGGEGMTYEEWGEIVNDCWDSDDDMYADWTADREELIRQRSSVSFELEMMDEYRKKDNQYLLNRAEAAEADLAKMTANAEIERLDKERAEAERDKLAERVLVLEKAIVEHRLVKWGDLPVEKPHDVRLYAALGEEK